MIALVPIGASRRSDLVEPIFCAPREVEQLHLARIRVMNAAFGDVLADICYGLAE